MANDPAFRRARKGHIISRAKSVYLVFYLLLLASQYAFTDSVEEHPIMVSLAMVSVLFAFNVAEWKLHRDCIDCITPPIDPATVADRKRLWLTLFHTRVVAMFVLLIGLPAAAFAGGVITDAHGVLATFFLTLAVFYLLVCVAANHHTRLSLWCHVCNPDIGGGGDHHNTPIPTAPNAKE